MPTTSSDAETSARIRHEFEQVKAAFQGQNASAIVDPTGNDGLVTVLVNVFKHTGGGEVCWRKGESGEDHRYTRFRSWGPNGTDFIEKTSYLKKANGHTEFHKRRIEAGDQVTYWDEADSDDLTWAGGLA